ncbi:MAG: cytochrome P450 [Cyanobium sp.]
MPSRPDSGAASGAPVAPARPLPHTSAVTGVLEALAFFRDPEFAQKRFAEYGNVFATSLLGQPLVFIRGGQAIGDLLAQPDGCEGWWPASVRQLLGSRSLANRNGPDHRARRRVVGQLFSAAALRRYSPGIVALVDKLAEELAAATTPVPLVDRLRRFAFAVIASVVLGLKGDDREALFHDFELWTRALFSVPLALPGTPFARALQARRRLLERLGAVLRRSRERAAAGEPLAGGLDLLSGGLDEAGLPLDDADVVEQLLLLLFAGYETTASSLSCLMTAVLQHPELEPWWQPELATLPWPPAPEQAASAYDPAAAPKLAALINEVMRLNPPVGGFFRRTTRELVLDGVAVPAGQVVQVALAASNRYAGAAVPAIPGDRRERSASSDRNDLSDPNNPQKPTNQEAPPANRGEPPVRVELNDQTGLDVPDDLATFRPQRHLEPGNAPTLLPFGGGERVCLGKALAELEIRLMAVGLLGRLKLRLAPDQDLSLQLIPSPSPRGGLQVLPLTPLEPQTGTPVAHTLADPSLAD